MDYVSGEIFTNDGFQKGYLGFKSNKIFDTGKGNPPKKPICKGLIVPSFVNCHIHIGDSFIRDKKIELPNNIEELVAPPKGLKHKLLKEATEIEIIDGMEKSIKLMIKSGTKHFCDFRENGILGISQLKTALQLWRISATILSRPDELIYDKNEINLLLKNSDGIGLSAISDWEYPEIEKIAKITKQKNKLFAIHASERIREDIDLILDLKPDFLIHMIKANKSDLEKVKDNKIPIVLCPRSNTFYKHKIDFKIFKEVGNMLMLGTDNAMINSTNVLDEIIHIKTKNNIFSNEDLLKMVTTVPRKVLNLSPSILGSNLPANFLVLDKKSLKPLYISGDN